MTAADLPITELENLLGPRLFGAQFGGPAVTLAGRYALIEIRGHGARGLVVKAKDNRLDRLVALKLFPYPEASLIAEAQGEARMLAQLRHANIVAVHDVDFAQLDLDGRVVPCLFLAMEYIEGQHLRAWIASTGPSPEDIVAAFLAAGEGLAAAHDAGIIHRDVKPANIVLDRETARMVDFGLARALPPDADPSAPRHTQYGVTKGTLEYMAPEARRGRADARSDQFSFAVSLWESLSGVLPFDPDAGEWRLGHQADFAGAESLPPALAQVLRRALSYHPGERHASMRELLDAVERATRRRRAWTKPALLGAGSVVLALAALAFAFNGEPPTSRTPGTEGPSPESPPTVTPAPSPAVSTAPEPESAAPTMPSSSPSGTPPSATQSEALQGLPSPEEAVICDADPFAGRWRLTTRVLWADDSYWIGVEGYYDLLVSVSAGCVVSATLIRTGDSGNRRYQNPLEAMSSLELERAADGNLWLSGEFELVGDRKRHVFALTPHGGELVGDWSFHEGAPHPSMTGILRAARGAAVGAVPSDLDASPCPSQCRILCAGPDAVARCLGTLCADDGELGAEGCGPADRSAPSPPGALALLAAVHDGTADLEAPGDKCRGHARQLTGAWTVTSAGSSHDLDLSVTECELVGEVRPRGDGPAYSATGRVNMKGQWFLRLPLDRGAPFWVFSGRNPAIGITSARDPLVAIRRR